MLLCEVPAHPVARGGRVAAEDALAVRLAPPVRLLVHPQRVRVREHLEPIRDRVLGGPNGFDHKFLNQRLDVPLSRLCK